MLLRFVLVFSSMRKSLHFGLGNLLVKRVLVLALKFR